MGCLTFTTSHLPRFVITVSCIIHHRAVKRAKQVQKTQRLYGRNATQTQFTCNLQVYYTQVHNSLVLPVFKHFYIAFNKEIYKKTYNTSYFYTNYNHYSVQYGCVLIRVFEYLKDLLSTVMKLLLSRDTFHSQFYQRYNIWAAVLLHFNNTQLHLFVLYSWFQIHRVL